MISFRERLVFDSARGEYRDGAIRYMMIRPDALMGLFAELPPEQRLGALAALGRSVCKHGGQSAASYQAMGATDAARMMQTIAQTAPQLGWGVWRFHPQPEVVMLEVENSPFAAAAPNSRHPVCHAITGMLTAIGPMVLGGATNATEQRCAAQDGGTLCQFRINLV